MEWYFEGVKLCTIEGCEKPHSARGWCGMHYMRWHTHGDLSDPTRPIEERFWEKVVKGGADECWGWSAAVDGESGRAVFTLKRRNKWRTVKAARIAYALTNGGEPEGMDVHHVCFNPACVNPAHLEPKTPIENQRLGNGRAACKRGHPFNEQNSYINARGHRQCRPCAALYQKQRKAKLRAAGIRYW